MSKLLRVKDYLLIAASFAGEIGEDIRLVGDVMPKIMETKYGFVPPNYKRASYLSSVSKLLSTGEIERKIDPKGSPYLELTSKGQKNFKRKFPILSMQKKKWDGRFMIVTYDIDRKENRLRDLLRNKLKELGFGMLQESVWISPYHFEDDFQEFVDSEGMEKYVYVLTAKAVKIKNYKDLVGKIWNLGKIDAEYQDILRKIGEGKTESKELWGDYFTVVMMDPMLPSELNSPDWKREKVLQALQFYNPLQKARTCE